MKKEQGFQWNSLNLGVCYYPEHWNKTMWEEDLKRMLAVGIETIRIGEFAWSQFELREGEFNYSFFDAFMHVVEKTGMKVIFGTPTATPPAWLTKKYPEVLNCDINGTPYQHGARRHYTYNSPKYVELTKIIVEKIASHYGRHPSIIGWQIDNEFNCELAEFYSESDTNAFRGFLKEKYESLEKLNDAWGTVFWNQTYTDWDQVYVPRKVIHNSTNPHVKLDYIRFVSASTINYCKIQSDIIRKYVNKEVFITTNGLFDHVDNHQMTNECLDVYTYDSYPNFAYGLVADPHNNKTLNDRRWSKHLTDVRSICPHFGIMEQQSGANGWNDRMEGPAPKPGQLMLWSMQSIAHGADFVSYFRWRTCNKGSEIYWHGILDYDNRDNRKLAEVGKVNIRLKKIQEMTGAKYKASVAVIKDYDNIWDEEVDRWHKQIAKVSDDELFVALQMNHTPFDYLYMDKTVELEALMAYSLIIYPHPLILNTERVALLKKYVEAGGCLVLGARTGMKDCHGQCVMTAMPGLATDLVGVTVEDFTLIGPGDGKVYAEYCETVVEMPVFNEILKVEGNHTDILAKYTNNYYKGMPAITKNVLGAGSTFYVGSSFNREIIEMILGQTKNLAPYKEILELEEGCEIAVRVKEGSMFFIVMNFMNAKAILKLHEEMLDMDTDKKSRGPITLEPFETKVYRRRT